MLTKEMLRQLREQKGLTGKQVAESIGIAYPVYQTYESGVRNAGLPVVEKLADFYGVTTDYLLGREPQPNPLAMLNISVNDKKFIEIYSGLSDTHKQIFVDTMIKLSEAAEQDKRNHK